MGAVVEAASLTKRYRAATALDRCDLALPERKVIGIVGPNGAGKTTLLQLAIGLRRPTSGSIRVLGTMPTQDDPAWLARVGFVAQDRPLYPDFTVAETLELARRLNVRWDDAYARRRVERFRLRADARVRGLSTGQRAQLALAVALGKRPELLLLDEPAANLDPLARVDLLEELMSTVADGGVTVVMSANVLADIESVCEHVVMLVDGRVQIDGDIDDLIAQHTVILGPRQPDPIDPSWRVIEARLAERQGTWIVRRNGRPITIAPTEGVVTREPTLEEIVVAYLRTSRAGAPS
jgi:ABC-2 type transport system ATP-binding protein